MLHLFDLMLLQGLDIFSTSAGFASLSSGIDQQGLVTDVSVGIGIGLDKKVLINITTSHNAS